MQTSYSITDIFINIIQSGVRDATQVQINATSRSQRSHSIDIWDNVIILSGDEAIQP